jgi:hypothetical protein
MLTDKNQQPENERENARPDRPGTGTGPVQADHSEREGGGDQDIDTAGMIPSNKATDDDEPTGM